MDNCDNFCIVGHWDNERYIADLKSYIRRHLGFSTSFSQMLKKFVFWWKRYIISVTKMLNSLVDEMHIIHIVIIMKTAIIRLLVFLKIFLKILELIFKSIILIRFNRFLVFIVESNLLRHIFESLINSLLLSLKLKMRSRIVLRSKKI